MIKKIAPYIPISLIMVLLLSVMIMFSFDKGRTQYVLFFPLDSMKGKNAEIRNIFRSGNASHRLDLFIQELLLGPVVLQMNPFITPGTKMKASLLKGSTLYLDFNKDFIQESSSIPLNYLEKIKYLEDNIKFNFSNIKEIVITVEGQIPGSGFYSQSEKND